MTHALNGANDAQTIRHRFCNALDEIRRKVIRKDGSPSGNKYQPSTDGISLDAIWLAMNGLSGGEAANEEAALELLSHDAIRKEIAFLMCDDYIGDLDALASKVSRETGCDAAVSTLLVTKLFQNGKNLRAVMEDLDIVVAASGDCVVNGVTIDERFKDYLAEAFEIGPNVKVKGDYRMIECIDDELAREYLTRAHEVAHSETVLQSEIERSFADLKRLDDSIFKRDGIITKAKLKDHVRRISHRYWHQKGVYAECHEEILQRIVAKTVNTLRVSSSEYKTMEWIFESAMDLALRYSDGELELEKYHATMAEYLLDMFNEVHSLYIEENCAYISMLFVKRMNRDALSEAPYCFRSVMDDKVDEEVSESEDDVKDSNNEILERPVTKKVGTSTVHTGQCAAKVVETVVHDGECTTDKEPQKHVGNESVFELTRKRVKQGELF